MSEASGKNSFLDFMHQVRAGELAIERSRTEDELRSAWRAHAKPHPRLIAARDARLKQFEEDAK